MLAPMITADPLSQYHAQEMPVVIVAALAYVLVIGSIAVAAIVICGWRGAQSVSIDWLKGKATFVCRR